MVMRLVKEVKGLNSSFNASDIRGKLFIKVVHMDQNAPFSFRSGIQIL